MKPVCVLIGPPGAGKTTVGHLLAESLGVAFRDTDADIEAIAGKTVPDIFIQDGEEAFRTLESAAIATALREFGGVLALGAGAILAPANRERLRGQRVVFLSTGFADAISRVGLGAGRPLLAVNPRATLKRLLEQRLPLYEEVATITVKTDGRTAEDVAAEARAALS